ncbi:hypothetical protein ACSBR2_020736 [Camellia fascicularis]
MGPKKRSGNDVGTVVRSTRKVVVKETVQISVSETKRKAEIVTPTKQTVVEDKTQEEEQDQTVQEQDEDHDESEKKTTQEEQESQRSGREVMKQVHPDMGISSKATTIINNFMTDMFERLAEEAARLSKYTDRMTLSSREVQGAVRLVLPGELAKHAIAEGTKAVTNYTSNTGKESKCCVHGSTAFNNGTHHQNRRDLSIDGTVTLRN